MVHHIQRSWYESPLGWKPCLYQKEKTQQLEKEVGQCLTPWAPFDKSCKSKRTSVIMPYLNSLVPFLVSFKAIEGLGTI